MTTCTGCNPFVAGSPAPTGGGSSLVATIPIYGNGNGAFSGITNFPMGVLTVYSLGSNGMCTGFSGLLTGTPSSGQFYWNPTGYTCTGSSSCRNSVYASFTANPVLTGVVPNFLGYVQIFDTEGRSYISPQISRSNLSITSSPNTYAQRCGSEDYMHITTRFILPPYSGSVFNTSILPIACSPCITG